MTKEVGFFAGDNLAVKADDPTFVKKIEDYLKLHEYEYLKLPGNDGQVTYLRIASIPAFTFRELSSIIGLDARPLALVKNDDKSETGTGTTETPTS